DIFALEAIWQLELLEQRTRTHQTLSFRHCHGPPVEVAVVADVDFRITKPEPSQRLQRAALGEGHKSLVSASQTIALQRLELGKTGQEADQRISVAQRRDVVRSQLSEPVRDR